MTLAEIIEEGERRQEECVFARDNEEWDKAHFCRSVFWEKHGPRLLAVARAAVEMREGAEEFASLFQRGAMDCRHDNGCEASGRDPRCTECRFRLAVAAFDDAAGGKP
jgi:hypothetical protein